MQEELISFETAKLAKDKGFDEYCSKQYYRCGKLMGFTGYDFIQKHHKNSTIHNITHEDYDGNNFENYHSHCTAPTQALLQKWLREKHNIDIDIRLNQFGYGYMYAINNIKSCENIIELKGGPNYKFTYEEALEISLQQSLKLI